MHITGADPGFQVRGAHLKKLRREEEGANNFGVFRVKNYDFTPKNLIFPIAEGGAKIFGYLAPVLSSRLWFIVLLKTLRANYR
jgi:hypothetical protein